MDDFSKLSDEELRAIANEPEDHSDLASMSDEELRAIANPPSALESGIHGALSGASMGWLDELSGVGEAAGRAVGIKGMGGKFSDMELQAPSLEFGKNYEEGRDKKRAMHKQMKETNPSSFKTGEFAGGLSTALVPGLNAAKGLRGAMATGAALGAVTGAGSSEADDAQGLAIDTLTGLGIGGGLGAGIYGAGAGIKGAANFTSKKLAPALEKMLPIGKKANAKEIEEAAKRLGFEATPGMTHESQTVQGLESSLEQSPTIGGWLARKTTQPMRDAMEGTTKELTEGASSISPWESGQKAKNILSDTVSKKFKPSQEAFEDLAQYTKDIPVGKSSVKAVGRNIMQIPEVETFNLPMAKQVVKALEKNPSADQVKMLRGMVGKAAKSSTDANERSAYWQMYAKLGRLEENTIKRGVIESARSKPEANKIAGEMLGQLKGAKAGYAKEMGALEDFSQAARLGKPQGGPSSFIEKLDAIPNERLQERLLPLEDARLAQKVQTQFPEAFDVLKGARLQDLSQGVHVDGRALPGKLLQNTKSLNPEAQDMLFGPAAGKLDDLRSLHQALPAKVGPSGTSQAIDFKEMLNPITQGRDLMRYGAYKAASSETLNKVAAFLRSQPKFANMAEQNPKAFQAAVLQFAKKVNPEGGMSKAAGFDPKAPQSDEQARDAFLDQ